MADIDTSKMSEEEIAELQKQNCIFCKIATKQIPAKILHEDEKVICILDINPASEGHILVYPKEHYMILPHIPDDLLLHLFKIARLMSETLLKALQTGGTSVFIANGMAAGQKAPHVLIHVFPRKTNDGLIKLPSYDMTDDQKKKLKSTLKPYFNQLFGPNKFVSKKTDDNKKTNHNIEINDNMKVEKEIPEVHEKKTVHKKNEKQDVKKDTQEFSNKEKKDTVNLDDIAKLFGG
jgi:histidine triad (HIT) family protein